jgi:hypothetical protein
LRGPLATCRVRPATQALPRGQELIAADQKTAADGEYSDDEDVKSTPTTATASESRGAEGIKDALIPAAANESRGEDGVKSTPTPAAVNESGEEDVSVLPPPGVAEEDYDSTEDEDLLLPAAEKKAADERLGEQGNGEKDDSGLRLGDLEGGAEDGRV